MKNEQRKSIIFCPCGKVNKDREWILPVIDLAGFIRELETRQLATFTFVKVTCPDCFQSKGLGEHHGKFMQG
jgi:hypothetical protein